MLGRRIGKRYAVSGKVTYKGAPVAKGRINFIPAKAGVGVAAQGASGPIVDGAYTLTTLSEGDGALPGDYKVSVDSKEADEAKLKAETEKLAKKHGMESLKGQVPPELMNQAMRAAKSTLPDKYATPEKSGLTAKVKEESNKLDFDLTD